MKILKSKVFITSAMLIVILLLRYCLCSITAFIKPSYDKTDITSIINSKTQTAGDYVTLFEQTGVAPAVCKELLKNGDSPKLSRLQRALFNRAEINKEYIFYPFTAEERIANATPLVPLKNGDILVTFNTHTLSWRHGHCAIVTDAVHGEILEHRSIGVTSTLGYAPTWGTYPAFAVLRYSDEKKAEAAASYAREHLLDIDYNILAGIIKKDKSDEKIPSSSHCSHIVWQAYKSVGIDIDSNGGPVVTPHDVAMSDQLSVVQIFGLKFEEYEKRILK